MEGPDFGGPVGMPAPLALKLPAAQQAKIRRRIDGPIDATATHGSVTVSIQHVSRTTDGGLEATIAFTPKRATGILTSPGPTGPTLVLLKNGVVVSATGTTDLLPSPPAPDAPSAPPTFGPGTGDAVAYVFHADPQHPYVFKLRLQASSAPGSPCSIAMIVSDSEIGDTTRVPVYKNGYVNPDPLIQVLTIPTSK